MRAEIISIGTELLLGHITDTNATFLAQQLSPLGIDLHYVSVVGDNQSRLADVLRRARSRSDLVITTGGLGPTEDDVTREAIADVLGETPQVDPALETQLRAFFGGRGIRMPERNVKQAWLLPSTTTLANPIGTAPGWWTERDDVVIVSMPGVPREMYRMWQEQVVPRLRSRADEVLFTRIVRVSGMGESTVEERLTPLLSSVNPTIATYAKLDAVDVRVTAKADDLAAAESLVARMVGQARALLGDAVFGEDGDTLSSVILRLLGQRGLTLATMESCTGGLLASIITDVPGSSAVFVGGMVSYATELKAGWGVPADVLAAHGAVSAETARAMARAARERTGAAVGIGVTGVAGPDEQEGRPVGTVHIAIASDSNVADVSLNLRGEREDIKRRAAYAALNLLRLRLERAAVPR